MPLPPLSCQDLLQLKNLCTALLQVLDRGLSLKTTQHILRHFILLLVQAVALYEVVQEVELRLVASNRIFTLIVIYEEVLGFLVGCLGTWLLLVSSLKQRIPEHSQEHYQQNNSVVEKLCQKLEDVAGLSEAVCVLEGAAHVYQWHQL